MKVPEGDYERLPASDSAVRLLRALPGLEDEERDAARFLLACDFAELGLLDLAAAELRGLSKSPGLAPAAFVALARARSESGGDDALLRDAKWAAWDRMGDDDFAEAAWRVGRAAFRTGRYPEARRWLREIPDGSPWFPFARYLLAQGEYALGRYGKAIEATAPIFSSRGHAASIERLQERTAVLLGDMLIEIGLYGYAADLLRLPGEASPWRGRAGRDLEMATAVAALEVAAFDRAEAGVARVVASLDREAANIDAAVGSDESVGTRAGDLRSAWPPRTIREERRRWAARHATAALGGGFGPGRVLAIVWESLPPVMLYRLLSERSEAAPAGPTLSEDTRFFHAPRPEVAKALAALALLDEASASESCAARAARGLRAEAAAALVGLQPAPGFARAAEIATGCSEPADAGLRARAEEALRRALATEADRLRRALLEQRLAIDAAVAEARLAHGAAIRDAREPW